MGDACAEDAVADRAVGRGASGHPRPSICRSTTAKHVSRRHAEITQHGADDTSLTDPGSANGTFVNGQRLAPQTPYTLHNGDRIDVGGVRLVFQLGMYRLAGFIVILTRSHARRRK